MKTNLKDNIWIEGFDSECLMGSNLYSIYYLDKDVIYSGKTSDIPEELAKKCVKTSKPNLDSFFNYSQIRGESGKPYSKNEKMWFRSAKESIQSACSQPYCIIYKTK